MSGEYHFRFLTTLPGTKQQVWLDAFDLNDTASIKESSVFAKVSRISFPSSSSASSTSSFSSITSNTASCLLEQEKTPKPLSSASLPSGIGNSTFESGALPKPPKPVISPLQDGLLDFQDNEPDPIPSVVPVNLPESDDLLDVFDATPAASIGNTKNSSKVRNWLYSCIHYSFIIYSLFIYYQHILMFTNPFHT